MKTLYIPFFAIALMVSVTINAQDSARVANTLKQFLLICKTVDFSDPKVSEIGMFYKAAPFIVYQGDDEKRRWKDVANYNNVGEKEQVDQICTKVNGSVNQDEHYKITGYKTNKESEGTWHVIHVTYLKKERIRNATFAFLKIGDGFAIGDID